MKKIVFTLMIALATALSITACTEEQVQPSYENGGGVELDGVRK
jgi:hypothetical protein